MTRHPMRFRRGQAMLEYVLALVAVLGLVVVLGYLVTAAKRSAERSENLVRADYP